MTRALIEIAAELVRLEVLSNFELRGKWRRLHGMQPPKSLSRDLLLRGITYKIQERQFGGLSKSLIRRLTASDTSSGLSSEAGRSRNRTGN